MVKNTLIFNVDADLLVYRAGAPIALTAITATKDKEIVFSDGLYTTSDIDAGEIAKVTLSAYSAGTAQVTTVTLPGSAPADGSGFSIGLINTTIGTANTPRKVFYGATAAAVVASIVAEGARPDSFFAGWTASASSQVVTVTAPIGKTFRTYSPAGGTIVYTTAAVPPTGTPAFVAALEEYSLPYQGATNKQLYPIRKPVSRVVAGATYDVIVVDFYPVADLKTHNGRKAENIKYYFAVNKAMVTTNKTAADILAGLVKLS